MKESTISRSIIDYLNLMPNTRAIKMHSGRHQGRGEPDIVACIDGQMVCIETKRPGEHPTMIQLHKGRLWTAAGALWVEATNLGDVLDALRIEALA